MYREKHYIYCSMEWSCSLFCSCFCLLLVHVITSLSLCPEQRLCVGSCVCTRMCCHQHPLIHSNRTYGSISSIDLEVAGFGAVSCCFFIPFSFLTMCSSLACLCTCVCMCTLCMLVRVCMCTSVPTSPCVYCRVLLTHLAQC